MTADPANGPFAYLAVRDEQGRERRIPIHGRLFVGRECGGVDEAHRFLVDDDAVSRNHLEISLDPDLDQAWVTDRSTNGTRVNGARIERSLPVQLRPGDQVSVGPIVFEFCADRFTGTSAVDPRLTVKNISITELVMVVGDIATFSSISEYTDDGVLLESIDRLYAALHVLLTRHHGTLSNFVGDAFFATWETRGVPGAAESAVRFALEAVDCVAAMAPSLPLRDPQGQPVRMGWSIGSGQAAVSSLTGMLVTVLGDATNVTFRLSGIAGRDGWPAVVVTRSVRDLTADAFTFTDGSEVMVKGRTASVPVFGVLR